MRRRGLLERARPQTAREPGQPGPGRRAGAPAGAGRTTSRSVGVMRYIGIDPGQSGGLVLLNSKGLCLEWAAMPTAERETIQAGAKKGKKKKADDEARAEAEAALWEIIQRWVSESKHAH